MNGREDMGELSRLLKDLPYLREWRLTPRNGEKTRQLFTVFKDGSSPDRLAAALRESGNLLESLDVVILSQLPRDGNGDVDEGALRSLSVLGAHPKHDAASCDALLVGTSSGAHPARGRRAADVLQGSSTLIAGPQAGGRMHDCLTLGEALNRAASRGRSLRLHGFGESDGEISYLSLYAAAARVVGGLRARGVRPGAPVAIFADDVPVFLPLAWGCILNGNPLLPLAAPIGDQASDRLCALFTGMDDLCLLAATSDDGFVDLLKAAAPQIEILPIADVLAGPAAKPALLESDDVALLMLTSGSTGGPKLVMQTHKAILSYCSGASEANGFGSDDVSLNWFPLDHVGGLVMFHIRDVWLGCGQIQVKSDWVLADPLRWLDLLTQHRVTVSWAPNFAYALVNARIQKAKPRAWDLSAVRVLVNGGEMVIAEQAASFLRQLAGVGLKGVAMVPAWGMSETCSGVTYSKSFLEDVEHARFGHVRVGTPIQGVRLRIAAADGEVLTEGEVGDLEISGAPVTVGYYRNDAANQAAFTADGWFRTGDIASLEDGELMIRGRSADRIIINGRNFAALDLEVALSDLPGIELNSAQVLAVGGRKGDTDELVVVYVPLDDREPPAAVEADIRRALRTTYGLVPSAVVPLRDKDLPRSAIGKVLRPELLRRIETRLGGATNEAPPAPDWFVRPTTVRKAALTVDSTSRDILLVTTGGETETEAVKLWPRRGYRCDVAGSVSDDLFRRGDSEAWQQFFQSRDAREYAAVVIAAPVAVAPVLHVLKGLSALLRGWNEAYRSSACRLFVIGALDADAAFIDGPTTAAVSAWLKSASAEFRWLRSRMVSFGSLAVSEVAGLLLDEICACDGEEDVLHTASGRQVRAYGRAALAASPRVSSAIIPGGFYLVSGGLGGIGAGICAWLLRKHQAKLLLLGRTDLAALTSPAVERARRLAELRSLGEVDYAACDLADADRLAVLVRSAETRFGPLRGAFHLAGVLARNPILEQTAEDLAAAFGPKSRGLETLIDLLAARAEATLVSFSSANGHFGGAGVSAHAAASAYQNARVTGARRAGLSAYAISWSAWPGVGQGPSAREMEIGKARGYHPVEIASGLASLEAVLRREPGDWIAGIDVEGEKITYAEDPVRRLESFVIEGGGSAVRSAAETRRDASYLQQTMNAIWRQALDLEHVGDTENFFDIGGTSLLVPQIREQVRERLGVDMPAVEIFKFPTIQALTSRVEQLLHAIA